MITAHSHAEVGDRADPDQIGYEMLNAGPQHMATNTAAMSMPRATCSSPAGSTTCVPAPRNPQKPSLCLRPASSRFEFLCCLSKSGMRGALYVSKGALRGVTEAGSWAGPRHGWKPVHA
jgi:hypothetical protein